MPTTLTRPQVLQMFRAEPGRKFRLKDHDPAWDGDDDVPKEKRKELAAKILSQDVSALAEAQELLYADDSWSLLVIFQAHGRGRQGRHDQARHVGRQSAGRARSIPSSSRRPKSWTTTSCGGA